MRVCTCKRKADVVEAGWSLEDEESNRASKSRRHYAVQCDCGKGTDFYATEEEAIKAWEGKKFLEI